MTDADKELYDKAEELFCQNCKLRTEQCLFAYRKVNGIEDCHKSCGYNKANEWHYPSKGELPKCDEKTQLIFYVNCYYKIGGETLKRKRTVLGYYQNSFLNDDIKLFVEKSKGYEDEHLPKDVIAWKEIVLPKLISDKEG